jgi:hypothetical protein
MTSTSSGAALGVEMRRARAREVGCDVPARTSARASGAWRATTPRISK